MAIVELLDSNSIQNSLKNYKKELDILGVETIHLFGSVARNEAKQNSDIDFLVKFKSGMKNFDNYINLTFLLEDIFKVKVDLLTTDSISGSLKISVESESVLIEV
ncbi:nucleotidyltransferase domain-containing protein [Leptospira sp. 2 VSF19]|uniref:Nucleotidyltransferase domain-containing protein n=1 Tax=Leptospira soteropolitanensis TaxID=2950025 RepID=A0AAW5VM49_9LEPT|nr:MULTISPECIES: nucleotidyltransferase domain-containing protein [Leptospira]MCG6145848.1 nucleotidyltransferase domain-containing protein [Leptospira bandrabouensis]MCG6162014.1 nucleotidyltransferase domain-containing protein [Leptospira bandrabouensis]MCG6166225.1 nucleotidyltransferase domain-containing protein [Leptospira bandrabouensis]MCW7494850.1 nucleotidyltransferase domain-containing protein [Leptospira soteropolitanensis]MCW7502452.1 nucleotidyltransferase domain-containing protei